MDAAAPPPPELLDGARQHRDGIVALLRAEAAPAFPGVPLAWCEGVSRLATVAPPGGIELRRWAALASTAARLLRDHGAELHAAGWDALDLFGLHREAPAANPPGWGLAWLLGEAGAVLDVLPATVGMTCKAGGARLAYRRRSAAARVEVVPAWDLAAGPAGAGA